MPPLFFFFFLFSLFFFLFSESFDSEAPVLRIRIGGQTNQGMKVTGEQFVLSPSFDTLARRDYSSTEFRANDRIINESTASKKQASLTLVATELLTE